VSDFGSWASGGALLLLGGYISVFGFARQIINSRNRAKGIDRYISGTPPMGPLFFFFGWYVSPLAWSNWALLIFIVEVDTAMIAIFIPYALLFDRKAKASGSEEEAAESSDD
jgi:UDP-N-acetylmuramyl pentapeptide phosphotransferase/UDP-N-acetylglucosamine-1-phosphate transferase